MSELGRRGDVPSGSGGSFRPGRSLGGPPPRSPFRPLYPSTQPVTDLPAETPPASEVPEPVLRRAAEQGDDTGAAPLPETFWAGVFVVLSEAGVDLPEEQRRRVVEEADRLGIPLTELAELWNTLPDDEDGDPTDGSAGAQEARELVAVATESCVRLLDERTADHRQELDLLREQVQQLQLLAATDEAEADIDQQYRQRVPRPLVGIAIRVTAVTIIGALVGGPVAALITHSGIVEKIAEAAFTSLVGSVTAEGAAAATSHLSRPYRPGNPAQWRDHAALHEAEVRRRLALNFPPVAPSDEEPLLGGDRTNADRERDRPDDPWPGPSRTERT